MPDHPYHNLTLAELKALPTLRQAQADDLKIEEYNPDDDECYRVWLCRCGIADGLPRNNIVTIELLRDGRWEMIDTYEAK